MKAWVISVLVEDVRDDKTVKSAVTTIYWMRAKKEDSGGDLQFSSFGDWAYLVLFKAVINVNYGLWSVK